MMLRRLLPLLFAGAACAQAASPPGHAVASAHPVATEAGLEVLRAGGNAFDAAVAVSAALGAVEPNASGIGGGGFFLLHDRAAGRTVMLDARERAPLAAHRDLYLDGQGEVDRDRALNGPLAAGIPGIPAAWGRLAERYGRLPLAQTLAPAARAARAGVPMNRKLARALQYRGEILGRYPGSAALLPAADAPPDAVVMRQPDLAATLELLAAEGAEAFYRGPFAERLVSGVRAGGGIWTPKDLERYAVVERAPVTIRWRGAEIETAALPSASGVMLAQVFGMLGEDWPGLDDGAAGAHRLVEALRRAYLDRARYLGDPDHVDVPVAKLTGAEHAAELMRDFDPARATPSADRLETAPGGDSTSHFSVLDADGNWVSATLSINTSFGSGYVVPGTGVLLNNEMDDFSAKPGAPNLYGLVGSHANAIAPGKRMLSSMAPTAVRAGERLALFGTPGGARITTMVLQGILAFLDGADAEELVSAPRMHHQAFPDEVEVEHDAFDDYGPLQEFGHQTISRGPWGNMQAVVWDRKAGTLDAASDPRGVGEAAVELVQR